MKHDHTNHRGKLRGSLVTLAAAAIVALGLATPAAAGRAHGHHAAPVKVHRHVEHRAYRGAPRFRRGRVVTVAPRAFVVPARIGPRYVATYRPYFAGRFFDARLGAYVEVYRFPVRVGAAWIYRPHYYRDGALLTGYQVAYDGPRLSFRLDF